MRKFIKDWLYRNVYLKRAPDLYIGGSEHPYLLRWYVIPRNPLFNVYFHVFKRSDHAAALHDHPWLFNASLLLDGGYTEVMFDKSVDRRSRVNMFQRALPGYYSDSLGYVPRSDKIEVLRPLPNTVGVERKEGDFAFRWGKAPHRVQLHPAPHFDAVMRSRNQAELDAANVAGEDPVSTLFITGPKIRSWGFYCKQGWRAWKEFLGKYESAHEGFDVKGCD